MMKYVDQNSKNFRSMSGQQQQQQPYRDNNILNTSRPCTPINNNNFDIINNINNNNNNNGRQQISSSPMTLLSNNNTTIFDCHYCNGQFNNKKSLSTHLQYQCIRKQFSLSHGCCRDCGDHFKQYDEFLRHISRTGHVNQNKNKSERPTSTTPSTTNINININTNNTTMSHHPSVPKFELYHPLPVRGNTSTSLSGATSPAPINSARSCQTASPVLFKPIGHQSSPSSFSNPVLFSNHVGSGNNSPVSVPVYDIMTSSSQQQNIMMRPQQQLHHPQPQVIVAPLIVGSLYFAGEVKPDSMVAGAAWMILDAHDGLIVQGSAPVQTPPQPQITPSQIRAEYEALYQGLLAALQHRVSVLTIKGTSEMIHAHFFHGPRSNLFTTLFRTVEDFSARVGQLIQKFRKVTYELVPTSRSCFTRRIAGDAIHLFENRRAEKKNETSSRLLFMDHHHQSTATTSGTAMDANLTSMNYPSFGYSSAEQFSNSSAFNTTECESPNSRESESMKSTSRATSSSNTPPRQFPSTRHGVFALDSSMDSIVSSVHFPSAATNNTITTTAAVGLPDWLLSGSTDVSSSLSGFSVLGIHSNSHFM